MNSDGIPCYYWDILNSRVVLQMAFVKVTDSCFVVLQGLQDCECNTVSTVHLIYIRYCLLARQQVLRLCLHWPWAKCLLDVYRETYTRHKLFSTGVLAMFCQILEMVQSTKRISVFPGVLTCPVNPLSCRSSPRHFERLSDQVGFCCRNGSWPPIRPITARMLIDWWELPRLWWSPDHSVMPLLFI